MVKVNLWLGLRGYTDGKDTIEVEATNIGELLTEIVCLYPNMAPVVETGVSVAVDGQLIANDRTHRITPESEVYLLQQLKGG